MKYESFSRLARLLNCDLLKIPAGRDRYRDYLNILLTKVKSALQTSPSVGGEGERQSQHLYLMSLSAPKRSGYAAAASL